jgi:hypothetical protein
MGPGTRRRHRLRGLLLAAIGLLYLLSVPWYRDADASPPLWLGLPSWVATAVACYLAAACLNAVAWWIAPISDELADLADGPAGHPAAGEGLGDRDAS